jgi:hypothetical protein
MNILRCATRLRCVLANTTLFVFTFAVAGMVVAQGIITGGITGSVVDQTGAAIPGATVAAIDNSTGTSTQVKSDVEGSYLITNVPIGSYSLSISAPGFADGKVNHVQVVAGNATSVGKTALALGAAASQTVEVEAGAAQLINTESSQGELVVDSQQLQTMPVDGAMDDVTLVVPGVVQTHSDGFSNTNGVNFSVNGERGRSNNSEIDGQSNNDNSIGGPSFFFSNQDAVAELQIVTDDFSAQYGRNMGSVVNYITKSGTNAFHGTGFEYYTGSFLSSLLQTQKAPQYGFCAPGQTSGCAVPVVPRFVGNNWGGTLGGPFLKDKLWGFGSTYFVHQYEAGAVDTSGGSVLPDSTGLKQLQSAFPNNPAVIEYMKYGPASVSQGNPTFFGTPAMIPVTDGTTITNVEVAPFKRNLNAAIQDQEDLGRIDYQLTPKDRLFVRYNYQNNPYYPGFYLFGAEQIAAGGYVDVLAISHQAGGDWTHTFTPALVNQIRYSFQQTTIGFESGTISNCTLSNFGPCSSAVILGTSAGVSLAPFGYASNEPQGRVIKVNQVQDNASWTRGRHTVIWGGEFDHQDSPNYGLPSGSGTFTFTPGSAVYASGSNAGQTIPFRYPSSVAASQQSAYANGLTGMLEGVAEVGLSQGNPTIPFREPDYALYVQDNWKVIPNLTLNLGVRYEFFSQSVNLLHDESVAQQNGSHPFWSTSLPLSATTYPHINSDFRNVEPRLGIAYTPGFTQKMVVHAGFAINVDPEFYNIFLNSAQSAPLVDSGDFGCDGTSIQCLPGGGLTFANVQAADTKYIPTGGDPRLNPTTLVPTDFRNPMAETYTLGVQYEVFPAAVAEVRYVGNHTFGQFQSLNSNPDILDVQKYFPGYGTGISLCTDLTANGYTRPNCSYNAVDTVGNTAFSIYNGLQTSLTIRNFHNWTGTASYTYSRTIDNVSEIFSTGSGGTTNAFAQDPLNTDRGERGVSGNSYPNVWGIQLNYAEPWFTNQGGILSRVLGGYFMNAFYQYNGGQPFNPYQAAIQTSPWVNPNDPLATTSFCDFGFALPFTGENLSQCRPILANRSAPITSVGINVGAGEYINYVTGLAAPRSSFHWLWNNKYEAIAMGNPFPGVGRNVLRGDSFNNLDLTVGKQIKITEQVNMLLQAAAFDVMNRAYYGTPDANMEDSQYPNLGAPPSFLMNTFTGYSGGSAAAGGAFFQGAGNRNVQLGAKISF